MKKYELTDETVELVEHMLHRIKALRSFGNVKEGDLGGFVESEENLSHDGNAWIYGNACVYGNAFVFDNAHIFGDAWVCDNARVYDNACVFDNARVYDNTYVFDNARVYDNAWVFGNARVYNKARVYHNARVYDNAWVCDNARVYNTARVFNTARISSNGHIESITDYTMIQGFGTLQRSTTFFRCKDGEVRTQCGCFCGTIDEFREQVKKTREGKIAKDYLLIADLMENHFSGENRKDVD